MAKEKYKYIAYVGATLVALERSEQIMDHNRTAEYDVKHNADYQLTAAIGPLLRHDLYTIKKEEIASWCPKGWDKEWWLKMMSKPYHKRVLIAGALCAAEYDRSELERWQQYRKRNNLENIHE